MSTTTLEHFELDAFKTLHNVLFENTVSSGCGLHKVERATEGRIVMTRAFAMLLLRKYRNGDPSPALPSGWTQEHAAKAAWMINTLANTVPAEWLSKPELYDAMTEFRALTAPDQRTSAVT